MAEGRRWKRREDLGPEERAKFDAVTARWHTPEAIEAEVRNREAIRATAGAPHIGVGSPEDDALISSLAGTLRAAREQAGLSLAEVAERAGIDPPALSRIENGRGNPTLRTISRYCRAIGGRVAWRFEPVGDEPGTD